MQKVKTFSLVYALTILTVVCLHHILRDDWFFYSDLMSMTLYLTRVSLFVSLIVCVLFILKRVDPAKFSPKYLLFLQFIFLISLPVTLLRIPDFVGFILVALLYRYFSKWADDLIARAGVESAAAKPEMISLVVLIGAVVINLHSWANQPKSAPKDGKKLILFVLDGLSYEFLSPEALENKSHPFHRVKKRATAYKNFRTNRPYTAGFFGNFYRGSLNISDVNKGLMQELSNAGVHVALDVYHQNGIPEVAAVSNYKGIRSFFITQYFSWVPRFLGLNYHTFFYSYTEQAANSPTLKFVLGALNLPFVMANFRDDIKRDYNFLAGRSGSLFYLVHRKFNTWAQEKSDSISPGLLANISENNWRYSPEYEGEVQEVHSRLSRSTLKQLHELEALVDTLIQDENVTVILTADHGTMMTKGKMFYSFHPDEEVLRVPTLVIQKKLGESTPENYFDTLDLSASILDYFGIPMQEGRNSIFKSKYRPKKILSLSEKASGHLNEHYLVWYDGKEKTIANVHPKSDRKIASCVPDGMECELKERAWSENELHKMLAEFGETE